jgi:hypothetical protein
MIYKIFSFVTITILVLSCSMPDRGPWSPLFNETDFSEFEQRGGKALYRVEDGTIIGTTVPNTENSFMCTRKIYTDFILECEVFVDTSLNSGIQIRSNAYLSGRVHGYQVEIEDKHWRLWSGGIYDEARRDWLNNLADNEAGRQAYRKDEWNHYRIEAIGNSIKTFVNGVMCANLIDDADASGFIAFQVHNVNVVKEPWTEGVEVKWRNIRIMTEELDKYRFRGEDPVPAREVLLTNRLTGSEEKEGWELLFDGESTEKWRGAGLTAFPETGWKAVNGTMQLEARGEAGPGDILTIEVYSDFELFLEFKLAKGSESGIKYLCRETEGGHGTGPEFQLIDDENNPDALEGDNGSRTCGSLYDLVAARKKKRLRGAGEWNMAKIHASGNIVKHYLNGEKVLEYSRDKEDFKVPESGHILLEDRGHEVAFRNIKIRKLNPLSFPE